MTFTKSGAPAPIIVLNSPVSTDPPIGGTPYGITEGDVLADGSGVGSGPLVLAGLSYTWGRDDGLSQPEAGSCTLTMLQRNAGDDFLFWLSRGTPLTVVIPDLTFTPYYFRPGPVWGAWSGFIDSVEAGWDDELQQVVFTVQCLDLLAFLGNLPIGPGDTVTGAGPWPMETGNSRLTRILYSGATLDGFTHYPNNDPLAIPGALVNQTRKITERTDTQLDLLHRWAVSADAVVGSGWDGCYPGVSLEAPSRRAPFRRLVIAPVTGYVAVGENVPASATVLPGTYIDAEDVKWRQDASSRLTRAEITWRDQASTTPPDDPNTAISAVNGEAPTLAFGINTVAVDTDLVTSSDALTVGSAYLARASQGWTLNGVSFRLNARRLAAGDVKWTNFLHPDNRAGQALWIPDVAAWSPVADRSVGVYVEGAQVEWDGEDWFVTPTALTSGGAGLTGTWAGVAASVTMPTQPWSNIDPSLTWLDLVGVGNPA